jgi:hypothetical protein
MSAEILAAIIAAGVAVVSAIIAVYGQTRITRLQHQFSERQEERSQEARAQELIAKYRDPLLRSAFDLQSRIYNITQKRFLNLYLSDNLSTKRYSSDNTLYVIAEYLGWVEILRREVQFLDLGNVGQNQRLNQILYDIRQVFYTSKYPFVFRLFNGQQRAIGELMMTPRKREEGIAHYECIGYATFSQKLHEDEHFAEWFSSPRYDFECLVQEREKYYDRLILLQNKLIDLIDFLDPEKVRISTDERQKIPLNNSDTAKHAHAAEHLRRTNT